MSDDIVRLKNLQGADEVNIWGKGYRVHSDQCFYVPQDVAQAVTTDGRSGFFAPDPDEHWPAAGSCGRARVESAIRGLADSDPLKVRLLAALNAAD
jgi:hypothetical protein